MDGLRAQITRLEGKPVKAAKKQGRGPNVQDSEDFAAFWGCYPRKIAKGAARKAWNKLRPDPALSARILQAVAAQSNSQAWTKDGGQFIPHPATWLNQERWEDTVYVPEQKPIEPVHGVFTEKCADCQKPVKKGAYLCDVCKSVPRGL